MTDPLAAPTFCAVHPDLWVPCPECPAVPDNSLDDAWAEAEAALPDGAVVEGVGWERGKDGPPDARYPDRWHARAYRWDAGRPWERLYGEGPTPAAALRALTAKLREAAR